MRRRLWSGYSGITRRSVMLRNRTWIVMRYRDGASLDMVFELAIHLKGAALRDHLDVLLQEHRDDTLHNVVHVITYDNRGKRTDVNAHLDGATGAVVLQGHS